jgi:hypothetical protein
LRGLHVNKEKVGNLGKRNRLRLELSHIAVGTTVGVNLPVLRLSDITRELHIGNNRLRRKRNVQRRREKLNVEDWRSPDTSRSRLVEGDIADGVIDTEIAERLENTERARGTERLEVHHELDVVDAEETRIRLAIIRKDERRKNELLRACD